MSRWMLPLIVILLTMFSLSAQEPVVLKTRSMKFPFKVAPDRISQMRRVEIHVSKDEGKTWQRVANLPPTATEFVYEAPADGKYWFQVVTVDRDGTRDPDNLFKSEPAQKVVVDTKPANANRFAKPVPAADSSDEPLSARPLPQEKSAAAEGRPLIIPPVRENGTPQICDNPPSDAEVLRAMPPVPPGIPYVYETFRDNIVIVKNRLVDKVDAPRVFPKIGPAQLHHCHWECIVYFDEIIEMDHPFPMKLTKHKTEVIYFDKDFFKLTAGIDKPVPTLISAMHEKAQEYQNIKRVYIAPIESLANPNPYKGIEQDIRRALIKKIEAGGKEKAAETPEDADAELKVKLVSVVRNILNRNQQNSIREEEIVLTADVSLRDCRTGKYLWTRGSNKNNEREAVLASLHPLEPGYVRIIVSSGRVLPELGESITTGEQKAVKNLALMIADMREDWTSGESCSLAGSCASVRPPYIIESPDMLLINVTRKLTGELEKFNDSASMAAMARLPMQEIAGQFLVRPDGTVGLGIWGSVRVHGLTMEQAAEAIRKHLAANKMLKDRQIAAADLNVILDVFAYNSKFYYVIYHDGGNESMNRLPISPGGETVLDAMANIGAGKGTYNIRIIRPGADKNSPGKKLVVDWAGIMQRGETATNYILQGGDRLFVERAPAPGLPPPAAIPAGFRIPVPMPMPATVTPPVGAPASIPSLPSDPKRMALAGTWFHQGPGVVTAFTFRDDELTLEMKVNDEGSLFTITLQAEYAIAKDGTMHGLVTGVDVKGPQDTDEDSAEELEVFTRKMQGLIDQPFALKCRPNNGGLWVSQPRFADGEALKEVDPGFCGFYKSACYVAVPTPNAVRSNPRSPNAAPTLQPVPAATTRTWGYKAPPIQIPGSVPRELDSLSFPDAIPANPSQYPPTYSVPLDIRQVPVPVVPAAAACPAGAPPHCMIGGFGPPPFQNVPPLGSKPCPGLTVPAVPTAAPPTLLPASPPPEIQQMMLRSLLPPSNDWRTLPPVPPICERETATCMQAAPAIPAPVCTSIIGTPTRPADALPIGTWFHDAGSVRVKLDVKNDHLTATYSMVEDGKAMDMVLMVECYPTRTPGEVVGLIRGFDFVPSANAEIGPEELWVFGMLQRVLCNQPIAFTYRLYGDVLTLGGVSTPNLGDDHKEFNANLGALGGQYRKRDTAPLRPAFKPAKRTTGVVPPPAMVLPSARYLQHTPQYFPPVARRFSQETISPLPVAPAPHLKTGSLKISIESGAKPHRMGETVPLLLRITNEGSESITKATVRTQLSEGLWHQAGSLIEAQLPDLPAGETRVVRLTARADKPGQQTCIATIFAPGQADARAITEFSVLSSHLTPERIHGGIISEAY